MAQSKEQMNGGEAPSPKPYYDRRITILCIGTALMDFTSHIASQATPAYAISMLGGDMEAVAVHSARHCQFLYCPFAVALV